MIQDFSLKERLLRVIDGFKIEPAVEAYASLLDFLVTLVFISGYVHLVHEGSVAEQRPFCKTKEDIGVSDRKEGSFILIVESRARSVIDSIRDVAIVTANLAAIRSAPFITHCAVISVVVSVRLEVRVRSCVMRISLRAITVESNFRFADFIIIR